MPTSVCFYALEEEHGDFSRSLNESFFKIVVILVQEAISMRRKCTVLCADQVQAEELDEFIWRHPADEFIPHNLFGEGPTMGTPVEINWLENYQTNYYLKNSAFVVNLSGNYLEQFSKFNHLIDFVPHKDADKAKARERYKRYKQAGCPLDYKSAKEL